MSSAKPTLPMPEPPCRTAWFHSTSSASTRIGTHRGSARRRTEEDARQPFELPGADHEKSILLAALRLSHEGQENPTPLGDGVCHEPAGFGRHSK